MPFVGTRRKRARKREVSSLQLGSPRRRSNLGESPGTRGLGGGGGGPRRVPSQHGAPHRPPAAVPPHWRVCARVCPVCRPPAHARSVRSSPGQSSRSGGGGGGGDGGGGGCGVRVEEDGGSERLGVPPAVRNPECGKRGLGRSASAQILSPAPSPSSPAERTRERGAWLGQVRPLPLPGPRRGAGGLCPLCHGSGAGPAPRAGVGAGWPGGLAVVILDLPGLGRAEENPFPGSPWDGGEPGLSPLARRFSFPHRSHERVCD